jgi:hypothetical protein
MQWYITPIALSLNHDRTFCHTQQKINTFASAYSLEQVCLSGLDTIRPKVHGFKPNWGWWIFKGDRSLKHNLLHKGRKISGGSYVIHLKNIKKNPFAYNKRWAKVKFRCNFRSPTKLPTLLLDAAGVTQLRRPLAKKSGNNFKSPNRAEAHWTTG